MTRHAHSSDLLFTVVVYTYNRARLLAQAGGLGKRSRR
jgi:hypothetical protein